MNRDFLGSEFDWLALDKDGNFGYFCTAGEGWIPDSVLANAEPFWDTADIVATLPVIGKSEPAFTGTHNVNEWIQVADRGLYAFDWKRGTKRYELVARPTARLDTKKAPNIIQLAMLTCLACCFYNSTI